MTVQAIIFVLGLTLAVWDVFYRRLPNVIVLPAIAYGIYLTGNWHFALLMFLFGALFYSKNRIAGGDVKLLCLFGAFMGPYALIGCGVSFILLSSYRTIFRYIGSLPYTPFLFLGSFIFFLK